MTLANNLSRTRNIKKRAECTSVIFLILVVSGCGRIDHDQFTLKTDMPANFKLEADGYYVPATGEDCSAPPRKRGYVPDRRFFTSEMQPSDYTAVFNIPLKIIEGGCPLVLNSLKIDIEGRWGPGAWDVDRDIGGIYFRDSVAAVQDYFNEKSETINGKCQWLFRTIGAKQFIVKILKCRAIDSAGETTKRPLGATLERAALQGKILALNISTSNEESPYMGDTWIKHPNGWKRCMGKSPDDQYAFCRGNIIDFKSFRMPDGRECNIYPSCVE